MFKRHVTKLKKQHKAIELKLLSEIKSPEACKNKIEELRKMQRQAKELILNFMRQKSIHRKNRYRRRTKRLSRIAAAV